MLLSLAAVAATALLLVTYALFEPDFWQHLLVGKVIWQTHAVPGQQIWTWPTYGTPDITPSWLFRVLIWPLWEKGGVWGLFAWRWLVTFAMFGLAFATARRMGSRGFAALGVLLMCVLAYRTRSQIRPETLVSVLIALQIWLLESRRQGGADRSAWVVAIAWVWANAHISYYLGFVILGAYVADAWLRSRSGGAGEKAALRKLLWLTLASAAISFLNPFGWGALWQPVDYFLHLSHEPIFRDIKELQPFNWADNLTNGLDLLLIGWPLLVLWRVFRRKVDVADLVLCVAFTTLTLTSLRFFGFFAIAGAPFIMRDLDEGLAQRPWSAPPGAVWWKAVAVLILAFGIARAELRREEPAPGVSIDWSYFPVRACDFMAEHGVRGRGFNPFYEGGYLLYRFWPDRERLPFMDIHQAGGPGIRLLYLNASSRQEGWPPLDRRFHFEYAVVDRRRHAKSAILDALDSDTTWAMVFVDDAAAVYVRRTGPLAPIAERFAYHRLPGGLSRLGPLGNVVATDSTVRNEVVAELQRQILDSPWHAGALSLLANVALMEGRYTEARTILSRGLAIQPTLGLVHERLGLIDMEEGKPRDALAEFEHERRLIDGVRPGNALLIGAAWRRLGDPGRARAWYRRELKVDPGSAAAAESLAALERSGGR